MPKSLFWTSAGVILLLSSATARQTPIDPERILASQFQFTSSEVAQARQGQPVVKVKTDGDELALVGAIRLPGKKERLSDWVKNIEHFRRSAELGVAQAVPTPPTAAAFAGVALDAGDLDELQHCVAGKCAIRLGSDALARLREVKWGSPDAASQANGIFRAMLLGYTSAYLSGGHAGVDVYDGPQSSKTFDHDMRVMIGRAQTLTALSPALVAHLERFPSSTLPGSDQFFYWSAMPSGSATIVSVHHLVVYRAGPGEIWIADKNLYASRYFDAAALAIGLYDAPDGSGFYAVAGSRMKASQVGGVAGTVLRRQIQRSATDSVKIYLEWIRDSLAAAG